MPAEKMESKPTREGFYHGDRLPAEFVALCSLFLRRRVRLGPVVRVKGVPLRVYGRRVRQSAALYQTARLDDLVSHMVTLQKLPEIDHEPFLLACRMYQQALDLLEDRPDLAYLLLVSAIEVFVGRYGKHMEEDDLPQPVRAALAKIPEEDARQVLLRRILELDRGITRNFVQFVLEHTQDSFWQEGTNLPAERGRILKGELPKLLKTIYNQRSLTLHDGEPFPPNVFEPPNDLAEIDRTEEITVEGRRWTASQFLPYPRFFERLVQHVLLTFLDRRTKEPDAETVRR
jgi:hypothetical protein